MDFKATVIAGVLSTLLAAALSWAFGFWPVLFGGFLSVGQWTWKVLSHSIPVPLGVIILLLLPVIVLVHIKVLILSKQSSADERYASQVNASGDWNSAASPQHESFPLSGNEVSMLAALAHADGQELALDDLARRAGFSNLVAEQTAEYLLNRRYLVHRRDVLFGSMLRLSPAGRDFVLSAGY